MNLHEMLEARARLWEQTKAHLDNTDAASADAAAEASYRKMHADLSELDSRITEAVDNEKRAAQMNELREKYAPAAPQLKDDSDAAILRKMANGEIRAADFESRTQNFTTNTAGGYTVPTNFYDSLYEVQRVNAGILRCNPTVIRTASGAALQIPKATTHQSAAWITEGSSITASDAVFAQSTLNAFKAAVSVQVSTELEQDTAVDLEGYLARRMGESLGNLAGTGFVSGSGTGQPTGFLGAATLGVTGGTGVTGAFTADNLIDLYFSVIEPYRMRNAAWLMSDATLGAVRKLKDGNGRYLFDLDVQANGFTGSPMSGTILGKPVVTDPNMPAVALSAKSVAFGDWSAYYVRYAASTRVERSTEFAFQSDLVTWRAIQRVDGKLLDSAAIKYFAGAGT